MFAGQLRTRVNVEKPATGVDAIGQPLTGWVTHKANLPADFRIVGGLEAIRGDLERATSRASCRIRFRDDIDTTMRVTLGGVAWEITAVLPDIAKRRYVDLLLEAVA